MPLDKQELAMGTRLTGRYKKQDYTCEVVQTEEGIRYRLADGREFKSLSAAGMAITGGAVNGWRFWSLTGAAGPPGAQAAESTPTEATPAATPAAAGAKHKVIKRTPNQKGVPEGQVKWFCSACMSGFLANAGETPEVCPQGHRAETDGNGQVVTTEPQGEPEEALPF